jgi:phosphoribosylformylglycinamidine synthase II/formyltetrahydrofolate-dependent phosphoribosylglycinamide formyltransferase
VPIKIAVLVSGRGSNLEAILAAIEKKELEAEIAVVLSNNPDSYALKIAKKHNIPTVSVDHRGISRKEHEKQVLQKLKKFAPDYLVLAGYMRILSGDFLTHFKDDNGLYRVINIHPSLLPAFPGKSAYEDAFNYGVKISGITVHLVDEQVDHGPILAQGVFERKSGDTLETFQARGLELEHKLFPQVLAQLANSSLAAMTNLNQENQKETAETKISTSNEHNEDLCVAIVPKAAAAAGKLTNLALPLYWLSGKNLEQTKKLMAALKEILADQLLEDVWCVVASERSSWLSQWREQGFKWFAERQYLPGVTDNLARTVEEAIKLSGLETSGKETTEEEHIRVASGSAYLFDDSLNIKQVENHCRYRHYHPVTDKFRIHDLTAPHLSKLLEFPQVHLPGTPEPEVVALNLSDTELENLSRKRTLALNLTEMQAIRAYYEQASVVEERAQYGLGQWPTDVELEVIAQTWSEHCKHKIFNAIIHEKSAHVKAVQTLTMSMAGTSATKPARKTEARTITSLYKSYVQASTKKLAEKRTDLLSVFVDNAGVIKWNDDWGICFKVETHNSPSALEPYGGALTGILGVNRDILGTGLGAKPICNTDVFCFAYPSQDLVNRPTMLPAQSIIQGVRKGVQDGGNKSGIPTVNGAVYFHPGYRAKPLVFCGTGGLLPLTVDGKCGYEKHTKNGDAIIMVGGRVGKDGIHGATFSSEALNVDSPVSAVQIGDPFTQKRVTDFILEARDLGLISGITDNGAGGLSSSVGEMAQITGGATLEVDHIPLKYPGLADYEIVISESQERMTLSSTKIEELKELAEKHSVELTVVGKFDDKGFFRITRADKTIALLDLKFLHDGAPRLELEAHWQAPVTIDDVEQPPKSLGEALLALLAHANICSREPVIRQYDHEVQGGSVIKPLMGPEQTAPCDAAVIQPLLNEQAGLAVSNGMCPQLSDFDSHLMAICAVDEAVRNAVCVGADPNSLALLDNFCWPDPVASKSNPDGKRKLAQLVQACEGLYEAVLAYNAPLISGKDSMKNDFDDGTVRISIPPTLLVSAIGKVPDIERVVTMDFKSVGDHIFVVSAGALGLAATTYAGNMNWTSSLLPELNLEQAALLYQTIFSAMQNNLIESCHDLSEGGLAVAVSECIIGSNLGAELNAEAVVAAAENGARFHDLLRERMDVALFAEGPARLLVSVSPANLEAWLALWPEQKELASDSKISLVEIGKVTAAGLKLVDKARKGELIELDNATLKQAWQATLPFEEDFK